MPFITSNNLDLVPLVTGQASPETTANDKGGELDSFLTESLTVSVTAGNATVTAANYRRYRKYRITGNTVASRSVTLQAIKRQVLIDNSDAANTQAIDIKLGSTTLSLPMGKKGFYETDGTANGLELIISNDISGLGYAPLASPTFTGNPAAPTPSPGDNDTSIATTAFVKAAIDVVLGGVSSAFDTLSEIETALGTKLALSNVVGKQTIWIPAAAMTPRTTNGAAAGTVEATTNKNMIKTLDFDATTQEFAQFDVAMPKSWNNGTVTFQPFWSHAATTTNFGVVFGLDAVAVSDDDTFDVAFGTAQTSTDTGGTTDDLYAGPESSAITIAGTPATGDLVQFRVHRDPANGSDTMAVDARLHGIKLFFTTSAATDA
jgi:hypothetical protein